MDPQAVLIHRFKFLQLVQQVAQADLERLVDTVGLDGILAQRREPLPELHLPAPRYSRQPVPNGVQLSAAAAPEPAKKPHQRHHHHHHRPHVQPAQLAAETAPPPEIPRERQQEKISPRVQVVPPSRHQQEIPPDKMPSVIVEVLRQLRAKSESTSPPHSVPRRRSYEQSTQVELPKKSHSIGLATNSVPPMHDVATTSENHTKQATHEQSIQVASLEIPRVSDSAQPQQVSPAKGGGFHKVSPRKAHAVEQHPMCLPTGRPVEPVESNAHPPAPHAAPPKNATLQPEDSHSLVLRMEREMVEAARRAAQAPQHAPAAKPAVTTSLPLRPKNRISSVSRSRGALPKAMVASILAGREEARQHVSHNERLWNSSSISQFVFADRLTEMLLGDLFGEVVDELLTILDDYVDGLALYEMQ